MREHEIICKFYDQNLDKLPRIIDMLSKEELEQLKNKIIISNEVKMHQLRIMQTFLNKLALFSLCESKEKMECFIRNPNFNLDLVLNNTTQNHNLNDSLYI